MAKYFAGIDTASELSSLCVINRSGDAVREVMAASEPEAIIAVLRGLRLPISCVGLGTGLLSQWISDGLHKAGFQVMLLEKHSDEGTLSDVVAMASQRDPCNVVHLLSRKAASATAQLLYKQLFLIAF